MKNWLRVQMFGLSIVCIAMMCMCGSVHAQDKVVNSGEEVSSEASLSSDEVKEQNLEQATTEAKAAKKEVEIHKKALVLEKEKTKLKIKEAGIAKQEAQIVKETATDRNQVQEALHHAQQKEKEALAAQAQLEVAQNKLLLAADRARLAEEELQITQERVRVAEEKISAKNKIVYKKLFHTGIIIILGYLLVFLFVRIANKRVEDLKARHYIRKNIVYIVNLIIGMYILFIWIQNIGSITIFFSALGAGLVIVLQEPLLCIAGWVLILFRRPFAIGDRIEIDGVRGDVIDIRMFQTTLLEIGNWVHDDQSTGRIVNIPNSSVFKQENYNYSRGFEFIWNELSVTVTFESDWKKAEEIMLSHGMQVAEGMDDIVRAKIRSMSRSYMIYYEKLTPIVYSSIKDSGVELTLRYLTEARKRRVTHDRLTREILEDFAQEEAVNFAYTTYRLVK